MGAKAGRSAGANRSRRHPNPTSMHQQKSLRFLGGFLLRPGNFLLSHTLARAVQSGLRGLTSVFGMGTGGSLSLKSPRRSLAAPNATNPVKVEYLTGQR